MAGDEKVRKWRVSKPVIYQGEYAGGGEWWRCAVISPDGQVRDAWGRSPIEAMSAGEGLRVNWEKEARDE